MCSQRLDAFNAILLLILLLLLLLLLNPCTVLAKIESGREKERKQYSFSFKNVWFVHKHPVADVCTFKNLFKELSCSVCAFYIMLCIRSVFLLHRFLNVCDVTISMCCTEKSDL